MGHTLAQWQTKVSELVRDSAHLDLTADQITAAGLRPALTQYSVDRPAELVVEAAGAGSAYVSLPTGWVDGFSTLRSIEHPARRNPPEVLDSQSWRLVRSPSDVDVEQILLDRTPTASEYVRFTFTAPWPFPTSTAGDDLVDDVAHEAVSALAAAFCCNSQLVEAARSRRGSVPTQVVAGEDRTRSLEVAAKRLEGIYARFIGLPFQSAGGDGSSGAGSSSGPAFGALDYDPSHGSLFHGGRA